MDDKSSLPIKRIFIGVFLIGLAALAIISYTGAVPSIVRIPAGGIAIWAGPFQRANVTGTWFTASLVDNTVTVEVYFGFPQYRTMHFYAIVPYTALDAHAFVNYNGMYQEGDERIGYIKSSYHVSPVSGATIVNASFTPNKNFGYFELSAALGVKFHVGQLVAKRQGATDTVILTFAGESLLENDMEPFLTPDTQPVWNEPLLVSVEFPPEAFLSPETFPSPGESYVTADYRSVSFPVNFLPLNFTHTQSSLAESISCSITYPERERWIQVILFLGGLSVGLGGSLAIDSSNYYWEKKRARRSVRIKRELISFRSIL